MMRLAACFLGRAQWRHGRSRDETKYTYFYEICWHFWVFIKRTRTLYQRLLPQKWQFLSPKCYRLMITCATLVFTLCVPVRVSMLYLDNLTRHGSRIWVTMSIVSLCSAALSIFSVVINVSHASHLYHRKSNKYLGKFEPEKKIVSVFRLVYLLCVCCMYLMPGQMKQILFKLKCYFWDNLTVSFIVSDNPLRRTVGNVYLYNLCVIKLKGCWPYFGPDIIYNVFYSRWKGIIRTV